MFNCFSSMGTSKNPNISTIYRQLINIWKCFESSRIDHNETSGRTLFLNNSILINHKTNEPYYFEHFVLVGVTREKDLMELRNKCNYMQLL